MKKNLLTISIIAFSLILLVFLIYGDTDYKTKEQLSYFNNQVSELLKENNSAISSVSVLTNFEWDKLCFKRLSDLHLIFYLNEDELSIFRLDYKEYFVDESYVKGSLDGSCILYNEKILIKRKYSPPSKTVEFFKIT